jgi:hypothetical protein
MDNVADAPRPFAKLPSVLPSELALQDSELLVFKLGHKKVC